MGPRGRRGVRKWGRQTERQTDRERGGETEREGEGGKLGASPGGQGTGACAPS